MRMPQLVSTGGTEIPADRIFGPGWHTENRWPRARQDEEVLVEVVLTRVFDSCNPVDTDAIETEGSPDVSVDRRKLHRLSPIPRVWH